MTPALNTGRYGFKITATFVGRDCPGYNGKLLRDGKVVALVNDPGDGGMLSVRDWVSTEIKTEFETFARSLPPLVVAGEHTLAMDTETLLGQMAEAELSLLWATKICRNAVVFQLDGDTENWLQLKVSYSTKTMEYLRTTYGDRLGRILNTEIGQEENR